MEFKTEPQGQSPVAAVDTSILSALCKQAEDLLKTSPSIMTVDTLAGIDSMIAREEQYGVIHKLLKAIFEIIYKRMIYYGTKESILAVLGKLLEIAESIQDPRNSN